MPRYYHIVPQAQMDLIDHRIDEDNECSCNPRHEFDPESDIVFVIHDVIAGGSIPQKDIDILKKSARALEMRGC